MIKSLLDENISLQGFVCVNDCASIVMRRNVCNEFFNCLPLFNLVYFKKLNVRNLQDLRVQKILCVLERVNVQQVDSEILLSFMQLRFHLSLSAEC